MRHPNEISYFNRVTGAYWFFAEHHWGQWSEEYRILSLLSEIYSPGLLETSETIGPQAKLHYDRLAERIAPS